MRRLLLLRHAKSAWDDPALTDLERPLTLRGRGDAPRIGARLREIAPEIDLVLCSPAVRTRQTLELLGPLPKGAELRIEPAVYEAAPETLLRQLRGVGDAGCVLLVGHNPGLQRLALQLVGDDGDADALRRLREKYPTAAVADLSLRIDRWSEAGPATGRLERLLRPKEL